MVAAKSEWMSKLNALVILLTLSTLTYLSNALTTPLGVQAFVPLKLQNTGTTDRPAGVPLEITIDSANYQSAEASNLQNIEFFQSDGTVIKSWMQDGTCPPPKSACSLSTATNYWIIGPQILAGQTVTIYMGFGASSATLMDGATVGEAPQFTDGAAEPGYGYFDNGAQLFPYYQNFACSGGAPCSLPYGWKPTYTNFGNEEAGIASNGLQLSVYPDTNGCWIPGDKCHNGFLGGAYTDYTQITPFSSVYPSGVVTLETGVYVQTDTSSGGNGDYVMAMANFHDTSDVQSYAYQLRLWGSGNSKDYLIKCSSRCENTGLAVFTTLAGPITDSVSSGTYQVISFTHLDKSTLLWETGRYSSAPVSDSSYDGSSLDSIYLAGMAPNSGSALYLVYWVRALPNQYTTITVTSGSISTYPSLTLSPTSPIIQGTTDQITATCTPNTDNCQIFISPGICTVTPCAQSIGSATYNFAPTSAITYTITAVDQGTGLQTQKFLVVNSKCPTIAPGINECTIKDSVTETYPDTGGSLTGPSSSPSAVSSPTPAVVAQNLNSVPWLLTCPTPPVGSPLNAQYFYSGLILPPGPNPYVGGDSCTYHPKTINPGYSLVTDIYYGSPAQPAHVAINMIAQNFAMLNITHLNYSPIVNNVLSNNFAQVAYIFNPIPSIAQHAIWTWNVEVANLQDFSLSPPPSTANTITGLTYSPAGSGCTYNYDYKESTTLQSLNNYQIPFNDFKNSVTFLTPFLPYFTYNFSMPSPGLQYLNLSYDIFSPFNYGRPALFIDPFPIDTPSKFFVNYNGVLTSTGTAQLASQWSTLINNLASHPLPPPPPRCNINTAEACNPPGPIPPSPVCTTSASGCGSDGSLACNEYCDFPYNNIQPYEANVLGNTANSLKIPALGNVISMAASPNDYIFALNSTWDSHGNPTYYLTIMRTVNFGYYNNTNCYQQDGNTVKCDPVSNIIGNGRPITNPTTWAQNWKNYWSNVIQNQNETLYVINSINLNSYLFSPGYNFYNYPPGSTSGYFILPLNMSVDQRGDVFIIGNAVTYTYPTSVTVQDVPAMVELANSLGMITPTVNALYVPSNPQNSQNSMLNEVTVSPEGALVFAANQTDGGYVYVYSANSLGYFNLIDLSYNAQPYIGTDSSGNPTVQYQASLNTAYWLENGGLYGQQMPWIASYISTYSPNPNQELDAALYHHPVAIQDVNGYIYVLDNWAGTLAPTTFQDTESGGWATCQFGCTTNGYNGVYFDILMLRAVNSTGSNVPINPSHVNDMFVKQVCGLTSQPGNPPPTFSEGTCVAGSDQSSSLKCVGGDQCPANPSPTLCCSSTYYTGTGTRCTPQTGGTHFEGGYSYSCATSSSRSSTYYNLATGSYAGTNIYPPYGWVISANLTAATLLDTSYGFPISFQSAYFNITAQPRAWWGKGPTQFADPPISFCSANAGPYGCSFSPTKMPFAYTGSYAPIGPQIDALQRVWVGCNNLGCSGPPHWSRVALQTSPDPRVAFAPILHGWGFSESFNGTADILFQNYTTGKSDYCGTCAYDVQINNSNRYKELMTSSFQAQNYTKIFQGNPYHSCYSNDTLVVPSNSICTAMPAVQFMSQPVYTFADPFQYLESLGSPQFSTIEGTFSQTFSGGGAGAPQQSASNINSCTYSGVCPAGSYATINLNCNPNYPIGGGQPCPANLINGFSLSGATPLAQPITINSYISGNVIVPYIYTYLESQQYTLNSGGSGSCTWNPGTVVDNPTVYTFYYYDQHKSNNALSPIQGGDTYLHYLNGSAYRPNLSDFGVVLNPQLLLKMKTNRIYGSVYVNLTTNNLQGQLENQYVINATQQLNYITQIFQQQPVVGLPLPAYQKILAEPYCNVGPQPFCNIATCAACGGGGTCSSACSSTGEGYSYLCSTSPPSGKSCTNSCVPFASNTNYCSTVGTASHYGTGAAKSLVGVTGAGNYLSLKTGFIFTENALPNFEVLFDWYRTLLNQSSSNTFLNSTSAVLPGIAPPPITPPPQILYYVPVVISNPTSSPSPTNYPVNIIVDSQNYQAYEASNLQNVLFFDSSGTPLYSWLESGNSNTATNTGYAVLLPNQIPAGGGIQIYMGFESTSTNLLDPAIGLGKEGEAPQLSPTYAQYDNGAQVFPNFYQNFPGSSMPAGWRAYGIQGPPTSVSVSDGVIISDPASSGCPTSCYNYPSGIFTSTTAISSGMDIEAGVLATSIGGGGSGGDYDLVSASGITCITGAVPPCDLSEHYGYESDFWTLGGTQSGIAKETGGYKLLTSSSDTPTAGSVYSTRLEEYPSGPQNSVGGVDSNGWSISTSDSSSAISNLHQIAIEVTGPGSGTSTYKTYWIRMRPYFPQPTYSFGALYSNAGGGAPLPYNVLGYNRLIYVYNDSFNNKIYAPIDADIAYTPVINLSVSPVVDPNNPNQTVLYVSGNVEYIFYNGLGRQQLPLQNGQIYIYYGGNLDYANHNPLSSTGELLNAELCSFGKVGSKPADCVQSNPVWTGRTGNSNVQTFYPDYNSVTQNTCIPPPKGLLVPRPLECNIYGNDGVHAIPTTCPIPPPPPILPSVQRYCLPIFANGTGICTREVGLMGIVTTDTNGNFMFQANTCGIGQELINATYYGFPPPQPRRITQLGLSSSAYNPANTALQCGITDYSNPCATSQVINYQWAPNQTTSLIPIGLFELGYGSISANAVLFGIVLILVILLLRSGREKKRRAYSKKFK